MQIPAHTTRTLARAGMIAGIIIIVSYVGTVLALALPLWLAALLFVAILAVAARTLV